MALISHRSDDGFLFACEGSVINSRYVLTAAVCIANKNTVGVRVGEFDLRYETERGNNTRSFICIFILQDIQVEAAIVHENFEGHPKYVNDIGLIRLASHINFSYKNAGKMCLPITKELRQGSLENKVATVAGWGVADMTKELTVISKTVVTVYTKDECISYSRNTLELDYANLGYREICAGTCLKDACNLDSGIPLMLEGRYNNVLSYIQYGILSNGIGNCRKHTPKFYTAVSPFMLWILDNIKE
ncbi:CLIP domain-containing serine protease HP8-like [Epargyreus clarus]|uniref:CLIP domain-containing serine protease HP8-like n=1 Tax=Epargyreus clarus TaxID=520877 RepID=UPI003C30889E